LFSWIGTENRGRLNSGVLDDFFRNYDTTGGVMMSVSLCRDSILVLRNAGPDLRCSELVSLLEALGFVVRDGNKGGHKVYVHPKLTDFTSSSFNCGHGRNAQVKKNYIRNVIRVLTANETELTKLLGGIGT
jgi:predicted RNA binding protein YcfA (HicA-like mRNA interferase family)